MDIATIVYHIHKSNPARIYITRQQLYDITKMMSSEYHPGIVIDDERGFGIRLQGVDILIKPPPQGELDLRGEE